MSSAPEAPIFDVTPGRFDEEVVARSHEMLDMVPVAFVIKGPGAPDDAEFGKQIIAHCKSKLADFKVPRAVEFCELPKTSTGKIQKHELRKRAGSAAAIDV